MITTEMKDRILADLVRRDPDRFSALEMADRLDIPLQDVLKIMSYFHEIGFVRFMAGAQDTGGRISVLIPAMDFFRQGGFEVQDNILRANVKKLLLEIEALEKELSPKALDTAEKIASIGNSILSALRFIS